MAVMTNIASMTASDAEASPVAHTFLPASNGVNGVCRWQDREHNSGISLGFSTFSFSVREPVKPGGVTRVKASLSIPKLDTTTVVPTITGTGSVSTEWIFPGTFTLKDRENLKTIHEKLIGSAVGLGDNISQMQRPY